MVVPNPDPEIIMGQPQFKYCAQGKKTSTNMEADPLSVCSFFLSIYLSIYLSI